MTTIEDVHAARSLLFVPASRPDRFDRARESGADLIVLDLEDAVPEELKTAALANVVNAVQSSSANLVVRVNGADTDWHSAELAALAGSDVSIMVPKSESVAGLEGITAAVPGASVIALIETARGVLSAHAIAGVPGVARLALGNVDLAADLGVNPASHEALWRARTELVLVSAAHGKPGPIDGVTTALEDPAQLTDDLRHAVEVGFTAKLCIHPRQVPMINAGWQPSEEDVAWANRIIAAAGQGAVAVDGEMVDAPVVERARTILRRGEPTS